jgi:hypothetical protein
MKSLEEKGFVFNKRQPLFPQSLFDGECFVPINQPTNAMLWCTTWNAKVVWHTAIYDVKTTLQLVGG